MLGILSWIVKNIALVIGILEAILKAAAGIISLTPTKKDDKILLVVDKVFSAIKKILYTVSDRLGNKAPTIPN